MPTAASNIKSGRAQDEALTDVRKAFNIMEEEEIQERMHR